MCPSSGCGAAAVEWTGLLGVLLAEAEARVTGGAAGAREGDRMEVRV